MALKSSDDSQTALKLYAYNILQLANALGVVSNEYQALGVIISAIDNFVSAYGNWLGIVSYDYAAISTQIQIDLTLKSSSKQNDDSKSPKDKNIEPSIKGLQEVCSSYQNQIDQLFYTLKQMQRDLSDIHTHMAQYDKKIHQLEGK